MCNVHVCGGSGHGVGRLFQVFDAEGGDGGVDVVGRWACLVVRCVRDQSCVQPHWPTAQQPHISRAAGWQAPNVGERHGTFSWTQEAMCWSTFTSRSTLGLRKARAKYWIGLGTGKPVSEYSYWGSRSSMAGGACGTWWWVNPTCCGFVVPHSWRVWQPAYRPIHPAEAVPPEPTPKTTPLSPQPRSPSLHLRLEGVLGASGLVLGERGSLVRAGRAPTSPAARAHCKVPLVWMGGEPLAASGLEVQRERRRDAAHRPPSPPTAHSTGRHTRSTPTPCH